MRITHVAIDLTVLQSKYLFYNINRTVVPIDLKFKIDPAMYKEYIPDYARDGNAIKVVVSYFKGVDSKTVSERVISIKCKGFKILESFNQVYAEVPNDKIAGLLN
jgi:hypothetical protein